MKSPGSYDVRPRIFSKKVSTPLMADSSRCMYVFVDMPVTKKKEIQEIYPRYLTNGLNFL